MAIVIKSQPGDSVDDLIRKFKKQVIQEEVLTELKKRERYKKPSAIKKEKLSELRHRHRKPKKTKK